MPWKPALLLAFGIAHWHGLSVAGTIEQARIVGEPQMQVRNGKMDGCGFRLMSVPQDVAFSRPIDMIDLSFNLYSNAMGLLKAGVVRVVIRENGSKSSPEVRPIQSFWIKAPNEKPTSPFRGKTSPSDSPKGYMLYAIDTAAVTPLFEMVIDRQPVVIGVRVKGEPVDRIHSGTVQVSEQDAANHAQCMVDLVRQIEEDLGEVDVPSK